MGKPRIRNELSLSKLIRFCPYVLNCFTLADARRSYLPLEGKELSHFPIVSIVWDGICFEHFKPKYWEKMLLNLKEAWFQLSNFRNVERKKENN